MKPTRPYFLFLLLLFLVAIACQSISGLPQATLTAEPSPTSRPTPLPAAPVQPGEEYPEEPVYITGEIPYTSPFFLNTISEPFVLLEDQAGFMRRDLEFEFPLQGQAIGAVQVHPDGTLTYSLALPAVPQGTAIDVDNDNEDDSGVQVFAIAYWSNTWGGPFLEPRDGTGWSTAYASTITDAERDNEITGGFLIVWAPDDQQGFPTGFGSDEMLFTPDDPVAPIPAGYNIVDLNQTPFYIYKEAEPYLILNEGDLAINDFSKMSFTEAFEALFEKVAREYPFTEEKKIDWEALHREYSGRVGRARGAKEYYKAIRDFTYAIPDAHVGLSINADVFYEEKGGSFGLVLRELSDGRLIVTQVLPGYPGADAGIEVGAEILLWDGLPMDEAISQVNPYFGPYSTDHHRRLEQVIFLTRVPPGSQVEITFQNPNDAQPQDITLEAEVDYDSLFAALPTFSIDELAPPEEGKVLEESGLGYIRITTFSDDYNLLARLWDRFIQRLIDNEIPGLIIDVRVNSGGSGGLAVDFAGYFFDEEIVISRSAYYNEVSGQFEYQDYPGRIKPGPKLYEGPVAVLVSPYCISACEGFVYALTQGGRAVVVGHEPTAGAYGEVGRGQYELPAELSLQFPTGRSETPDGELLIEGRGVPLDITVPVTEESALGEVDAVLEAAVEELLKRIK